MFNKSTQQRQLEDLKHMVEDFNAEHSAQKLSLGSSEEDFHKLMEDFENDRKELAYSNDSLIDGIIKTVKSNTPDDRLKELLSNAQVINRLEENVAYTRGAGDIGVGEPFLTALQQVSDIAATLFLPDVFPDLIEDGLSLILLKYSSVLVYCLDEKKDAAAVGGCWPLFDLFHRIDVCYEKPFTDILVYFGREIYDMSVAFLVGHEIGHCYINEYGDFCPEYIEKKDVESEKWKTEYLADAFGVKFAVEYMNILIENGNPFPFLSENDGIFPRKDYRLLGLPILLMTIGYYHPENLEGSNSHPPLAYREDMMWEGLETYGFGSLLDEVKAKACSVKRYISSTRNIHRLVAENRE